jgi:hypothetical protein
MKYLKTFESYESPMDKEEMINHLCRCGWKRHQLEDKHEYELADMCQSQLSEGKLARTLGTAALGAASLFGGMNKANAQKTNIMNNDPNKQTSYNAAIDRMDNVQNRNTTYFGDPAYKNMNDRPGSAKFTDTTKREYISKEQIVDDLPEFYPDKLTDTVYLDDYTKYVARNSSQGLVWQKQILRKTSELNKYNDEKKGLEVVSGKDYYYKWTPVSASIPLELRPKKKDLGTTAGSGNGQLPKGSRSSCNPLFGKSAGQNTVYRGAGIN